MLQNNALFPAHGKKVGVHTSGNIYKTLHHHHLFSGLGSPREWMSTSKFESLKSKHIEVRG